MNRVDKAVHHFLRFRTHVVLRIECVPKRRKEQEHVCRKHYTIKYYVLKIKHSTNSDHYTRHNSFENALKYVLQCFQRLCQSIVFFFFFPSISMLLSSFLLNVQLHSIIYFVESKLMEFMTKSNCFGLFGFSCSLRK